MKEVALGILVGAFIVTTWLYLPLHSDMRILKEKHRLEKVEANILIEALKLEIKDEQDLCKANERTIKRLNKDIANAKCEITSSTIGNTITIDIP